MTKKPVHALGENAKGRQAPRVAKPVHFGLPDILVLLVLLLSPAFALYGLSKAAGWHGWITASVAVALSLCAFMAVWMDKRSAQAGEWRTPERLLHMLERIGGWPGSFLAQRAFRHKVSKSSYQIVFWFIVVVYEFVSIDSLQSWKWLRWLGTQF